LYNYGIHYKVEPIMSIDPLGGQTVTYFSLEENGLGPVPPGREVLTVRRAPGATVSSFDPSLPFANAVSSTWRYWETGDRYYAGQVYGDGHRCVMPFGLLWSSPGVKGVDNPNPRVVQAIESELDPVTGQAKWSKTTQNYNWDGFGHYQVALVSGTPGSENCKITFGAYDLVLEEGGPTSRYQLGRLVFSISGEGLVEWDTMENPHGASRPFAMISGQFRTVASTYTTAGLLATQRMYSALQAGFDFLPDSLDYSPPANSTGDKVLALTYNDPHGNISRLLYSGCNSTAQYGFNFAWDHGMVNQMSRDGLSYNHTTISRG